MNDRPDPDPVPPMKPPRPIWRHPLVLAGLPVVLLLAARLVLAWLTTPEALVNRLESQMNARVEIDSTELSLIRVPCRVELRGVRVGARDASADNAAKLQGRPAMERPLLSAQSMRIEGSPWALLTRKLDIRDLTIAEAGADIRIRENGSLNIDKLFKQPAIVNGKPNPRKKIARPVAAGAAGGPSAEDAEEAPTVDEMPMAATVKNLLFSGNRIQALVKGNGTLIDTSGVRFEVSDLDVDPANLAARNSGKIRFAGSIRVTNPEKGLDYATLHLVGEGTVRPFDPETREMRPLVRAKLTFSAPSEVSLLPSMEKINKKLEVLKRVGISLGNKVGKSIAFAEETHVEIEYRDGVIKTLGDLPARARKIDVKLDAGAWLRTGNNAHEFRVTLLADEELSEQVLAQVNKKARIIPAGKSRDAFLAELTASFFPGGRFQPVCVSSGDIGDPDIELVNELPDMGKFLKGLLDDLGLDPEVQKDLQDSAGELLKSLLNGQ